MSRIIYCNKLKKETIGLSSPPIPGEKGEFIFNSISKEAWGLWLNHQTMLINEYRLNLMENSARIFLKEEMDNFFSDKGSDVPEQFIPLIK